MIPNIITIFPINFLHQNIKMITHFPINHQSEKGMKLNSVIFFQSHIEIWYNFVKFLQSHIDVANNLTTSVPSFPSQSPIESSKMTTNRRTYESCQNTFNGIRYALRNDTLSSRLTDSQRLRNGHCPLAYSSAFLGVLVSAILAVRRWRA